MHNEKPIIIFVDDEPHQHVAFESIVPEDWEVHCFDNGIEALEKIIDIKPWLIISDQRMPQMEGIQFLETAKKVSPASIRVLTTGYCDEASVIQSIRKAQVYDYLLKPWDLDKIIPSLERALNFYKEKLNSEGLYEQLTESNELLQKTIADLKSFSRKNQQLNKELSSWVHPFVLESYKQSLEFPLKRNLALLVMDIRDSGQIHSLKIDKVSSRQYVLQALWECILKHGGEVEYQEGDKIYANFGLSNKKPSQELCMSAFKAALEFQSRLNIINLDFDHEIKTGLALHFATDCEVSLRAATLSLNNKTVTRKKFDTSSPEIDFAHRIEQITHDDSKVSKLAISEDFYKQVQDKLDSSTYEKKSVLFKGFQEERIVFISKSKEDKIKSAA